MKHVHLIGIGGTGMSSIARVLLEKGYTVTGSDRALSALALDLQQHGAQVFEGHAAENIQGADVIVRSSAIPDTNVEVVAARAAGIPVLKRSDFLGSLLSDHFGIAVAGSHGKTTTTAMLAYVLTQLGEDPSYIIGGVSKDLSSNAHAGQGKYFVIEADEYDRMGSSVGVSKCRTHSDLYEGLLEAAQYDRRILIERGVNGREIEVSVLGNEDPKASVAGEIRPCDDFYSYDAKYISEGSELLIPAPIDAETMQKVQEYAVRAYTAVDCAGMARVDFLLDRDTNELFLNEVNTIPGFTKISMYPKLWAASGLPYPELVQQLVDLAVRRQSERVATVRIYRSSK